MSRRGSHRTTLWLQTRRTWFKQHPADHYECYICGKWLERNETTLDHVRPKGWRFTIDFELSNLEACCLPCNTSKGSKSLTYYLAERDKQGLYVSDYARELSKRLEVK